ncbi:hypothetical protein BGW39_009144 [Mortierella sp. 14UC]|nr:hypothetical protein BGW39_009144 [Mortierella sp. 14UC]
MIAIIPFLSLALTLAATALGQKADTTTHLEFCSDSAHKKFFEATDFPVGNSTVPSFTESPNHRYCFKFAVNLAAGEQAFPSRPCVRITVYGGQDLIWNVIQPLCDIYTKAPTSVNCSPSSTSSVPDLKADESVISGCINLGTTDLRTNPHVKGKKGTVYVDFYNKDNLSFVCASGPVKFV